MSQKIRTKQRVQAHYQRKQASIRKELGKYKDGLGQERARQARQARKEREL